MDFRSEAWVGTPHLGNGHIYLENVSRNEQFPKKQDFPCENQGHFGRTDPNCVLSNCAREWITKEAEGKGHSCYSKKRVSQQKWRLCDSQERSSTIFRIPGSTLSTCLLRCPRIVTTHSFVHIGVSLLRSKQLGLGAPLPRAQCLNV